MARPKRVFSDEEEQKIRQYAHNNCNTETIANALDIPVNTLKRRFGRILRQERAQGKVDLRESQHELAKTSSDMSKFLGKNELNQTDKQILVEEKPVEVPESERKAYEEGAKAIKFKLSKTSPA